MSYEYIINLSDVTISVVLLYIRVDTKRILVREYKDYAEKGKRMGRDTNEEREREGEKESNEVMLGWGNDETEYQR